MNPRGCKRSLTMGNCGQEEVKPKRYRRDPEDKMDIAKKTGRPCAANAERERSRVKTLRSAFLELQRTLPTVPADTKLSKLDVLVLATTYIAHLMKTLNEGLPSDEGTTNRWLQNCYHPMKKWPMRSRLYMGITSPDTMLQDPTSSEPQMIENRYPGSGKLPSIQDIAFDGKI